MASIVSSCPLTANNSQENMITEKRKAKDAELKKDGSDNKEEQKTSKEDVSSNKDESTKP